jgi:surface carbohydrate biosynthesis protein
LNFYIPVEVKNRELHAKVLLAAHAARRGFSVILGRKNDLNELVVRMPAGVYLGLGAFENFRPFYARLQQLGFAVVVNEEEGLVTYSDSMYVDMRVSRATLEHVDELFTWGGENQRVLAQAFPEFGPKFHITGNPRFDLLKPQCRQVYEDEMRAIEVQYGDYILVCTSFSSTNHFDPKLDYLQSLIDKKTLRSQASIDNFKRYREVKQETFAAFLEAIPRLAAAHPGVNIVVRPHPSENAEVYRQCAAGLPNVHVDARFSVHPWILGARALVHHYCTTSIEALAAGTPRFALRPVKDELSEKDIPFGCSVECADVEQLLARVASCMAAGRGGWEAPPLPRDYSWYVSNIGEPWASAAIVDRVQGLAAAGALRSGSADSLQTRLARGAYALRKTARNVLRRGDHRYLDHKFARLSLPEVEDLLRAFDAADVEASAYSGDFIHIRQRREG